MNDAVMRALRCPVCAAGLARHDHELRCPAGHTFDIARQGYVNLLLGRAPAGADTPQMVAARAALFDAGHLAAVTDALVALLPAHAGLILDVGAGTGHHLAAVLDARPGSAGLALDVSKAAARRSARTHPALVSVVADVWRRLPLADGCIDVLLDVFAPRNGAEFHRVLSPDGTLLVVTPMPEHLAELVAPLGLLAVDPAKPERVERSLGEWFEPFARQPVRLRLHITRAEAALVIAMGPSSWHTEADRLAAALDGWPEPIEATFSVSVTAYRPRARQP
jgi:23S rRNA (guanine745-N1)-methyltransferase